MDADNLLVGKALVSELADYPGYLAPVDDCSGGVDSEAALSGECDYGDEGDVAEVFEEVFQCPDVSLILMYGVAQGVFVSVDVLCPVFAVLASVDPAFVEFGFDDEYAVFGYCYVVNLGGAA